MSKKLPEGALSNRRFRTMQKQQAKNATVLRKVSKRRIEGLRRDIVRNTAGIDGLPENWSEILSIILERYVHVDNDASGPVVLNIEPMCRNDGPKEKRNMHRDGNNRIVYPSHKRLFSKGKIVIDGGIPFDKMTMLKVVGRNGQGQRVTRFFVPSSHKASPTGEL